MRLVAWNIRQGGGSRLPGIADALKRHDTVLNYPGHLLGTARMGLDPERSVVNEWGRSHDVKNLFIVDGSIWVTSGGVNPTSTIQARALYIAYSIKKRLAYLFD
jgi:choline dehydrogenase-like flavoprotein